MFTLPACRHTMVGVLGSPASTAAQARDVDRALAVGLDRYDARRTEAQQAERPVDGGVPLGPDDHPDPRRAEQAVALDVPVRVLEDPVPAHGQADGVGRLRTGHEPDRCTVGQSEQLLHPAPRDPLGGLGRGDNTGLNPFWSHPVATMSAALEAGLAPPITNPK